MIATNKFIFIHLHKSGGTFINHFIRTFFPEAQEIGYHLSGRFIPQQFKHLPVIGFVRNPWSYYISWYTFQSNMANPNPVFLILSDNGKLDFQGTITNMLNLSENPNSIEKIASCLPNTYPNRGINLTKQCIKELEGQDIGFYSFMYERMYKGVNNVQIGKMERMRSDFPQFLKDYGVPISPKMNDHIIHSEKLNVTRHQSVSKMYNAELCNLVSNKDSIIIKKHDYTEHDE